jgi:type II secretory pathway component PulK
MRSRTYTHRSAQRAASLKRSGVAIIAALVCLLVVMAILGAMLRGTLRNYREMRSERDLRQAELLLQAAHNRVLQRIKNDTEYHGETWNLPADEIAGTGDGRVTIEITPATRQAAGNAKVMAEYPLGGETSIRRSLVFQIPVKR